jgi:hypothetical protein
LDALPNTALSALVLVSFLDHTQGRQFEALTSQALLSVAVLPVVVLIKAPELIL